MVRGSDDQDIRLVPPSPVEEGHAGVVAQTSTLLGLLHLRQQLFRLLSSGVPNRRSHHDLALCRLHIIIEVDLGIVRVHRGTGSVLRALTLPRPSQPTLSQGATRQSASLQLRSPAGQAELVRAPGKGSRQRPGTCPDTQYIFPQVEAPCPAPLAASPGTKHLQHRSSTSTLPPEMMLNAPLLPWTWNCLQRC